MSKPKKEGPSAQERALAEISARHAQDYGERYIPIENQLIKDTEFTAAERARLGGETIGGAEQAFGGLTANTIKNMQARTGAGSGATKAALGSNANARGSARGLGLAGAMRSAEHNQLMDRVGITGLGRNQSISSISNMSQSAGRATEFALQKRAARDQLMQDALGAAVAGATIATGGFTQNPFAKKAIAGNEQNTFGVLASQRNPTSPWGGPVSSPPFNPGLLGRTPGRI